MKKVRVACAMYGIDLQTAAEAGFALWLRELGESMPGRPEWTPRRPHDESMTDDVSISIPSSESSTAETGRLDVQNARELDLLNFYAEHSGNRLKVRDREALRAVLHFSDPAIKTGILNSILFCRGRVNSLRYCLGAIRESGVADVGPKEVALSLAKVSAKRGAQPNLPSIGADVVGMRTQEQSTVQRTLPSIDADIADRGVLVAFLAAVNDRLDEGEYQRSFGRVDRLSVERDVVRLWVPDVPCREQINLNFLDVARDAMEAVGLGTHRLEYVLPDTRKIREAV